MSSDETKSNKDEGRTATTVPPVVTQSVTRVTLQSTSSPGSQSVTRPEIPSGLALGAQQSTARTSSVSGSQTSDVTSNTTTASSKPQTVTTSTTAVKSIAPDASGRRCPACAKCSSSSSTSTTNTTSTSKKGVPEPVGGARSKMETTAPPVSEVTLRENKLLQGLLECAICTDELQEPRLLSCLHSFCTQCLSNMFESSDQRSRLYRRLTCPLCRKVDNIPAGGIACLPRDHRAESLRDLLKPNLALQAGGSGETEGLPKLCGNCKTPASIFCVDCMDLYCSSCDTHHRQSNYARDHTTIDLGGDTAGESPDVTFCRRHNKIKQAYCYDCNAELCAFCAVSDQHGRHDVQSLKCVTEILYGHVNKLLPTMEVVLERKRVKLSRLERLYEEREEAFTAISKLIGERTAFLVQNLEKQRDDLLEDLKDKHSAQARKTISHKDDVVRDISRLETLPNNAKNAAGLLRASRLRQYDAELDELEDPDKITVDAALTDYFDFHFEQQTPVLGQIQFVSNAFLVDDTVTDVPMHAESETDND